MTVDVFMAIIFLAALVGVPACAYLVSDLAEEVTRR